MTIIIIRPSFETFSVYLEKILEVSVWYWWYIINLAMKLLAKKEDNKNSILLYSSMGIWRCKKKKNCMELGRYFMFLVL